MPPRGAADAYPAGRPRNQCGAFGYRPAQYRVHRRHCLHTAAQYAQGVERGRESLNPIGIITAVGRLKAHHPAIRCRSGQGSRRLRTQGDIHHAAGDRGGRSTGRPPWRMCEIVRIPCLARPEEGKFRRYGFSKHNGTCRLQKSNAGSITTRAMAGINGRAVLSREPPGVNDILDAHRQSGQRANGMTGAFPRSLRIVCDECSHHRLISLDHRYSQLGLRDRIAECRASKRCAMRLVHDRWPQQARGFFIADIALCLPNDQIVSHSPARKLELPTSISPIKKAELQAPPL